MPSVVTIGASAFEHTLVEDVTLPATITSIGSRAFVGKPNGKRELHITIETATPPTIDGSFATHADAYVKVPDGSLGAYLPNLDLSKPFKNSGDTKCSRESALCDRCTAYHICVHLIPAVHSMISQQFLRIINHAKSAPFCIS